LLQSSLFTFLFAHTIADVLNKVLLLLDWIDAINSLAVNHGSANFHKVALTPSAKFLDTTFLLIFGMLAILFFIFSHLKSKTKLLKFLNLDLGELKFLILLRKKLKDLP